VPKSLFPENGSPDAIGRHDFNLKIDVVSYHGTSPPTLDYKVLSAFGRSLEAVAARTEGTAKHGQTSTTHG
jgi:hypothetical protein